MAAVVDPQRDIDRYVAFASERGLTIRHVFLTHFHADFVAGHLELRDRTGAAIYLGASARAEYQFTPLNDGRVIELTSSLFGDLHDARVTGMAIQLPFGRRTALSGEDHALADVVAASSSPPKFAHPHKIGGRRYIDALKGAMMRRVQFFEIHDQPWFPSFLRDQVTDDLQVLLNIGKPYGDILPQLREGIERAGADRVLDLCSGAGGPWPWLADALERSGLRVCVELSDKYPNTQARERVNFQMLGKRRTGAGESLVK